MKSVVQMSIFNDDDDRERRWTNLVETIYQHCFLLGIALWISEKAVQQACKIFNCTENGFWNAYEESFERACSEMYPNENNRERNGNF